MVNYDAQFLANFNEFSEIGAKNGGLHRLSASAEDGAARDKLIAHFHELGYHVSRDAVGNLFGFVLPPDERPAIVLGSHLDSQPDGGRFDGQVGVVTALWAARTLEDAVRTGHLPFNLGVVNWTNEEGARFQPSVLGSSVFAGKVDAETALESADSHGITLRQALSSIGATGSDEIAMPVAYVEVHVEQSATLESTGHDIGIVEGSWAALKLDVQITGLQTHTGPTPMRDRVDALYAAAKLVTAVHDMGLQHPEHRLHTTVGSLRITPDSPNSTPSEINAKMELRSDDQGVISDAHDALLNELENIGQQTGATLKVTQESMRAPGKMWPDGVGLLNAAAQRCGLTTRVMKTVAGHDALALNEKVPSLLFFIPSVQGYTHNRFELTEDRDLVNGLAMMVETVKLLGESFVSSKGWPV